MAEDVIHSWKVIHDPGPRDANLISQRTCGVARNGLAISLDLTYTHLAISPQAAYL